MGISVSKPVGIFSLGVKKTLMMMTTTSNRLARIMPSIMLPCMQVVSYGENEIQHSWCTTQHRQQRT